MKETMKEENLKQLPGSSGCFICDNNDSNPRSLRLKIFWDEATQSVKIPFTPDETWCGYFGIVHGGLVAAVVDEAQAWVVKERLADWAFTIDYHLRYRKALSPGKKFLVCASVENVVSRKISTKAQVLDEDGVVYIQANAVFMSSKILEAKVGRASNEANKLIKISETNEDDKVVNEFSKGNEA